MAQQLDHLTKDQLVKAVFAELESCYGKMTNPTTSRDYLIGKIKAYQTILEMVGISNISLVVSGDERRC